MTFSGFGEFWTSSNIDMSNFTTVEDDFVQSSLDFEMNNSVLLFVIIGISCVILLLLLCGIVFFCMQQRKFTQIVKHDSSVIHYRTILISKSTSITGLCEAESSDFPLEKRQIKVEVAKQGSCIDVNPQTSNRQLTCQHCFSKSLLKNKTSTQSVKNDRSLVCSSMQSKLVDERKIYNTKVDYLNSSSTVSVDGALETVVCNRCFATFVPQKKEYLTLAISPQAPSDVGWTTPEMLESASNAKQMYEAAPLHISDSYDCTEQLSYDGDLNERAELLHLYDADSSKFYPVSTVSEISPVSLNGVTSSLPFDAYGHPRAWFVPLDEIYHEPLRHSFIDVSHHLDLSTVLQNTDQKGDICSGKEKNKIKESPITGDSESKGDFITSINSESLGSEVLGEKSTDCGSNWRDSGIPTSQFNLRRCNSSDFDNKKPSLWEQREDRPVVFLQHEDFSVSDCGILSTDQEK